MGNRTCVVEGCDRPAKSWGMCPTHYGRVKRTGSTERAPARRDPVDRFHEKYDVDPGSGCWVWNGTVNQRTGYGMFKVEGALRSAHRWAYQRFVAAIPDGMVLDHLCRRPRCVNPAHLEPVTQAENLRRAPGAQATINAAKTHCGRGHEFTPENTYRRPDRPWTRNCRTCRRDAQRRRQGR